MKSPATLVALLHGPDQPGIVAKTAGWIFARHGNRGWAWTCSY
jgi:formyltetrahydrofolate deformylase